MFKYDQDQAIFEVVHQLKKKKNPIKNMNLTIFFISSQNDAVN